MNISAVIIVKNAERTLNLCLESLKAFDEVVLYDNGSTDKTLEIAKQYANVNIIQGDFTGFGPTKNKAATYAKHDRIFSIDSDEVVSPRLLSLLQTVQLDENTVYSIERFNYYRKKRVRFSGWGKEKIFRLYNKRYVKFNDKQLHETLDISLAQNKKHLKGEIRHYSFHKVSDFIKKIDTYSAFYANERKNKKKVSAFRAVLSSLYLFFNLYFIRLGILDGYRGLLISFSSAAGAFYKYIKLYELNQVHDNLKCSLIITTYNRPDALQKVLESVLWQTVPPDEIIIADDGSGEETINVIEDFKRKSFVPVIHSWQEDKGFRLARSRNKAIAKSKYNYIIVIDGDVLLHRKFISDHLSVAQKGYYVQGSRVLLNNKFTSEYLKSKSIKISFNIFSSYLKNKLNGIYSPFLSKIYSYFSKNTHSGIRGCNFSLFKSDIIKVNGFNEEFNSWGREDSEFVERLYNAGIQRKNLKFKGIQYHLFHIEGSAQSQNDELLQKAMNEKLAICKNGINQHLSAS